MNPLANRVFETPDLHGFTKQNKSSQLETFDVLPSHLTTSFVIVTLETHSERSLKYQLWILIGDKWRNIGRFRDLAFERRTSRKTKARKSNEK